MTKLRIAVAALVLQAVACSSGTHSGKPAKSPDAQEPRAAADVVLRLGRAIYEDDVVSAKATDLVVPRAPKDTPVRGWLTTRLPDGWRVDFFAPSGEAFVSHYRVTFPVVPTTGKVAMIDPPERLDDTRVAMIHAREIAKTARFPVCAGRKYNFVVLPAEMIGRSGWLVYLLAAHASHDEEVLGGHARVHVSADGRQLLEVFPLSKGCLVAPLQQPPPGSKLVGTMVSTLVSDHPLETHVFLSLMHRKPLYVVNRQGDIFLVDPLGLSKRE